MNKQLILIALFSLLSVQTLAELPRYRATQFSLPWDVSVNDSNSKGDVIYSRNEGAVVRNYIRHIDGTTTALPDFTHLGDRYVATAIDDNGNVAIMPNGPNDSYRVGLWNERDGFRMMPDAPFPISLTMSPSDITNSGLVSWSTFDFPGADNARGIWNINTNEVTYLPNTAGGNTQIWDVSENGYSVANGFFSRFGAVFHPDGSSYQLRPSAQYANTFTLNAGVKVSESGMVIGSGNVRINGVTTFATYVWDRYGQIIEERIGLGFGYSGITRDNLIVGNSFSEPDHFRPFLYERVGPQVLMESRIVSRNFTGELFGSPLDIHDNKAVFLSQGDTQAGNPQSYVFLEPVPEPGTLLALGAGLAALLRRKRTT